MSEKCSKYQECYWFLGYQTVIAFFFYVLWCWKLLQMSVTAGINSSSSTLYEYGISSVARCPCTSLPNAGCFVWSALVQISQPDKTRFFGSKSVKWVSAWDLNEERFYLWKYKSGSSLITRLPQCNKTMKIRLQRVPNLGTIVGSLMRFEDLFPWSNSTHKGQIYS